MVCASPRSSGRPGSPKRFCPNCASRYPARVTDSENRPAGRSRISHLPRLLVLAVRPSGIVSPPRRIWTRRSGRPSVLVILPRRMPVPLAFGVASRAGPCGIGGLGGGSVWTCGADITAASTTAATVVMAGILRPPASLRQVLVGDDRRNGVQRLGRRRTKQGAQFVPFDHFLVEEARRELVEDPLALAQHAPGVVVRLGDDALDLGVDLLRGVLGMVAALVHERRVEELVAAAPIVVDGT